MVGAEGKEQVKGSGVCGACGAVVWCGCVKGGKVIKLWSGPKASKLEEGGVVGAGGKQQVKG